MDTVKKQGQFNNRYLNFYPEGRRSKAGPELSLKKNQDPLMLEEEDVESYVWFLSGLVYALFQIQSGLV